MTPEMRKIVEGFAVVRRENPDGDVSTDFQRYLVEEEVHHRFDEGQLTEMAEAAGVDPEESYDFLEELASWL